MDKVPVNRVTDFESELYPFIEAKYPKIFEILSVKKSVDSELEVLLKKALEDFKNIFVV